MLEVGLSGGRPNAWHAESSPPGGVHAGDDERSPHMSSAPAVSAPAASAVPRETLRGRDIVCFGHDFTSDPLSKTHIMRILSRENRVIWVNSVGYRAPTASKRDVSRAFNKLKLATQPVKEVEPNLFVLNP